jgi:thiol-disulfide isomerase/thioredoxin
MVDPYARVEDGSSLSGHERNVLFLNREGETFENVSGVCGADDPADGRAVALLDYDRDGWQDLVVVNANAPQVQLFRNEVERVRVDDSAGHVLALRLEGGNRTASATTEASNRDGVGARIEVVTPDATLVREVRAGEGFAAQNSRTLLIGLGAATRVEKVRVRWPSGKLQESGPVAAGSLVTLREAPEAGREPFEVAPYTKQGLAASAAALARPAARKRLAAGNGASSAAPLRLLTTMATWCDSCKAELPQVAKLRDAFDASELALLGIPVDEDDDAEKLSRYEQEYTPAYELQKSLPEEQIEAVRQTVLEDLRIDALPAAIATDREGRVIRTMWEVPSISEVKQLLREVRS